MSERKPPGLSWESWIDKQIREAEERGAFANLRPGSRSDTRRGDVAARAPLVTSGVEVSCISCPFRGGRLKDADRTGVPGWSWLTVAGSVIRPAVCDRGRLDAGRGAL